MCSKSREKLCTTVLLESHKTQEGNSCGTHKVDGPICSVAKTKKKRKKIHARTVAQKSRECKPDRWGKGCPSENQCGPLTEKQVASLLPPPTSAFSTLPTTLPE